MAKLITQTKDGELEVNLPGYKKFGEADYLEFCRLNPHLQLGHDKKRNAVILSRTDGSRPIGICLTFSKTIETNATD